MPWEETSAVEQREQFIHYWLSGCFSKTDLCARFDISRPTGDKWIERHAEEGLRGLQDRSRRPKIHPNATDAAIREAIVRTKLKHPSWGPKKVLDLLRVLHPERCWPADSTGGEILARAGLVKKRRYRRGVPADRSPFSDCDGPNQVWSIDFKGDFQLGNGGRCYPLTVSDNHSRYLLTCQAMAKTSQREVRPWLEKLFMDQGLPMAIRSDNGSPFASRAVGGLSQLSKWWVDLGIKPERAKPGRPDQNGRHERMHRSLKAWMDEAAWSINAQQIHFDRFVNEYNQLRSHESLNRQIPAEWYRPSERVYPEIIEPPEYETHITVRRVRTTGEIRWRGELVYLSEVLAGEPVGMEMVGDGVWDMYYRFHYLGAIDDRTGKIVPAKGWHGKKV